MLKTIIIGTLHANLTPIKELEEILLSYKPSQILVEITQEDINKKNIQTYPPEMIFAYEWAIKNKIKVNGFDSEIDTLKEGITKKDNLELIEKQKKVIKNYSWKDFNVDKIDELLKGDITDSKKDEERNLEMLDNINKTIINDGVILILTGCAHLNFFEENIKNAILPLRYL